MTEVLASLTDRAAPGSPDAPFRVQFLQAAPDLFGGLAVATVAVALVASARRQRAGARRRALVRLASFLACGALLHGLQVIMPSGWWPGAAIRLAVAGATWGAALGFLRLLPRALEEGDRGARAGELERLRLLEAAVAVSGDGVIIAAPVSADIPAPRIVFANRAFEHLSGYNPTEAVGQSPTILPEADALDGVRAALRATAPTRMELCSRRKDGSRVWAEWHIVPVAGAGGRPGHWVAVLRDTTADRRARDELRQARDFLTSVLHNIPVSVAVTDARGRYRFVNPAWERATRVPGGRALGRAAADVLPGAVAADIGRLAEAARASGTPIRAERSADLGRGRRTLLSVTFPLPELDGQAGQVGEVTIDLTEQKQAERSVRALNAELKRRVEEVEALVELSPVGIAVVTDPSGAGIEVNRALRDLLGLPPEPDPELTPAATRLGVRFRRVGREVPHQDLPIQRCLARGESIDGVEFEVTRPDGEERVVVNSVRPLFGEGGRVRGCISVYTDVTDRVRGARALRESEALLRSVIGHIPCGVFWKDRNSVYLGCNDQVARDHGLAGADQVVGRTDSDLGVTEAEAAAYRDADRRVMETGAAALNREVHQTRPSGVRATLLTSKVPLRDAAGRVVGVLGAYLDITERKRLEEQFRQAQKLDAVGRLAGGIAHDFNNLLTVIGGNGYLLRHRLLGDPEGTELVDDLLAAAERAAALVRQLLTFSRRQPIRPEVVDLNEVVAGLAGILRRLLGERVKVAAAPAPGPVRLRIDRGQLEQVVLNLAVNARDAMPAGGALTIASEVVRAADGSGRPPGRLARLTVTDTGTGMSDEVQARLFEPFFTTKGPDKGTGLGLATVFGIVQQAGGAIGVESAAGQGATFRVDFPWCDTPPAPDVSASESELAGRPAGRGRTVLLVEDESAVRKLARDALETHEYTVAAVPHGEAALAWLGTGRAVDLLVTDMIMPGMSGDELAVRVRGARPHIGVVFVSGYVPPDGDPEAVPGALFLAKPFTPSDLLRAAASAVGRKSAAKAEFTRD